MEAAFSTRSRTTETDEWFRFENLHATSAARALLAQLTSIETRFQNEAQEIAPVDRPKGCAIGRPLSFKVKNPSEE